jgi:hypothetical protein
MAAAGCRVGVDTNDRSWVAELWVLCSPIPMLQLQVTTPCNGEAARTPTTANNYVLLVDHRAANTDSALIKTVYKVFF